MAEDYVSNEAWLTGAGRPDAIDELADQFERPCAAEFWTELGARRAQRERRHPVLGAAGRGFARTRYATGAASA